MSVRPDASRSTAEPEQAPTARPFASVVRRGCAQLFVVFTAPRSRTNLWTPAGRFVAAAGLAGRNILVLRDPFCANFSRGFGPLIPSVDALAAWIRDFAGRLTHVREVYTLGHSSGGYAAMLYGHLCQVDAVFAFAPRVLPSDGPAIPLTALARRLSDQPNGKTRYRVTFSVGNETDRPNAELFARCPDVSLDPRSEFGDAHDIFGPFVESGALRYNLPLFLPSGQAR